MTTIPKRDDSGGHDSNTAGHQAESVALSIAAGGMSSRCRSGGLGAGGPPAGGAGSSLGAGPQLLVLSKALSGTTYMSPGKHQIKVGAVGARKSTNS